MGDWITSGFWCLKFFGRLVEIHPWAVKIQQILQQSDWYLEEPTSGTWKKSSQILSHLVGVLNVYYLLSYAGS